LSLAISLPIRRQNAPSYKRPTSPSGSCAAVSFIRIHTMIANIASDDALILPRHANPARSNARERQRILRNNLSVAKDRNRKMEYRDLNGVAWLRRLT